MNEPEINVEDRASAIRDRSGDRSPVAQGLIMSQTLQRGQVIYWTKPLPLKRAAAFAQCLQANPRFTPVTLRPHSDGYRVGYLPATWLARQKAVARELSKRVVEDVGEFVEGADGQHWCFSRSGKVYRVTKNWCSCPDFEFRCAGSDVLCKHVLAYRAWRAAQ